MVKDNLGKIDIAQAALTEQDRKRLKLQPDERLSTEVPEGAAWPVVHFQSGARMLLPPLEFSIVNATGETEATRSQVPLILAWACVLALPIYQVLLLTSKSQSVHPQVARPDTRESPSRPWRFLRSGNVLCCALPGYAHGENRNLCRMFSGQHLTFRALRIYTGNFTGSALFACPVC